MINRNDEPPAPQSTKTVNGFALLVTSEGADKKQTCLGYLVSPTPAKLQNLLDFLRTCPAIQIKPAMLSGAQVIVNIPKE